VVEHLPSKCESLNLNCSTEKRKEETKKIGQTLPKVSKRKVIKIRAKMKEIEIRKTMEIIYESKSNFFQRRQKPVF
jgi:hypothetical protein